MAMALVFASLFIAFVMGVFWFAPKALSPHQDRILALISALLAGVFGFFMTGGIVIEVEWELPAGGTMGIQAFGGIALFVLVLFWWVSATGPGKWRRTRPGNDDDDPEGPTGPIVESQLDRLQMAHEEIGRLKEQCDAALRRAEDAEKLGQPEAQGISREVRERSDTTRLLQFLLASREALEKRRDEVEEQLVALNREIAAVAYLRGEIETCETALDEILRALPDDMDALNRMGHIQDLRGDLGQAEKNYQRVLELSVLDDHQEGQAVALGNLGNIYWTRGDLDKAEEMYRKALEINEQLGRREGMAIQYGNLGLVYQTRGEVGKAEEMYRKALEINEELGHKEGIAINCGNLANVYQIRSEFDKAEEMHRKSLEIHEELGCREGMAANYGNLGLVYESRRQLDEAREFWTKARDLYADIGIPDKVAQVEGWLEELE